jgi:FKBP-type peptidyl-prolyl cis-trans isomerase FklB
MRKLFVVLVAGAFASCNSGNTSTEVALTTFEDSASYAVGRTIGSNLKADFEAQKVGDGFNKDFVVAGLADALKSDSTKLTAEEAKALVDRFFEQLAKKQAEENAAAGSAFLEENKGKPGVITTESGLQYIVLKEGEGDSPTAADQVKVHYTGKLLNGDVFDSSIERNQPVDFYVRSVIPGWTEALQLMKPGAEYKLFIPSNLAYGEQGNPRGGIGPNEVLIFDVKLIDVLSK